MSTGTKHAGATWARNRRRLLPDVFLVVGAIASVVFAALSADVAWVAVWIGLAATLAVAAVVDVSAVAEQERRLRPIRSAVGRRIGKLHQVLLAIVSTTFDDLEAAFATEWPSVLRAAPDSPIDLATPAKVFPPRTRQQRILELSTELASCHDELMSLSAAGVLTDQIDRLDQVLSNSPFVTLVRTAFAVVPVYKSRVSIATNAAEIVEQVQQELSAAAAAAGSSWRYGRA